MTDEPRKPKAPPLPTTEGGDHSVPAEGVPPVPAPPSGMASEGDSDPRPGGMGSEG